jgi:hypothetical protein
VGEIQAHHTGWVIRARLLARSGTILPDGDDSDRSRDARGPLELCWASYAKWRAKFYAK